MRKRFTRGGSIALVVGLMLSGGAALAGGGSPAAAVKFKAGPEMPTTATRFDGATVDGKVYFLGFRIGTETDGSIWTYDIKKKKYADTGVDMPEPVSNYTIAVLKDSTGTALYTFGGRNQGGETVTTVQAYYPSTGKAKIIKTDPWPGKTPSDCVSLPGTGVAVVGNTAYVIGGMSFSTSIPACVDDQSKEVWSFDPMAKSGKKWSKQPALKQARGYVTPAVVGGNTIYAIGGDVNDAGTLTAQTTVESWKVGAKKWGGAADLPIPCDETQAFAYDKGPLAGTVTVAGCGQWPNAVPDVLQYDVKSKKWSTIGALLEARRNHAGANIGTDTKPQLMVVGGYNFDGSLELATSEIGSAGGKMGGTPAAVAHSLATGGSTAAF